MVGPNCVTMPTCVAIGQTVAEIWRFFDFSKMAAFRHLGFVTRVLGHPRLAFGGLYPCAKFVWNRRCSFDNMHVFRFREFIGKMPMHAPKIVLLGDLTPEMGSHVNET